VIDPTDALHLATVFGLGLAPFPCGLVQFANTACAEQIVRRLDELTKEHGSRFQPADHLRELAEQHRPMAQLASMDRSRLTSPQQSVHSST